MSTDRWVKQKIEATMSDLVDLIAANPGIKIDERVWRQLLVYAPKAIGASAQCRHPYVPHRKYPWLCEECGYPEHEILKHKQKKGASTNP